jgi:oxygen-independent coproporphyrinogen-3 oxidase
MTASTTTPPSRPLAIPALYVHIPFCFHKCHYCDFYSITRQTPERMHRFVDLILREADLWLASTKSTAANPIDPSLGKISLQPRTIFFGGGTPSLLPTEQMRRLISGLHQRFDFSHCREFTIEINPATATDEFCQMVASLGVNRVSMGAQSFNRAELATLERHHNPDDVPRSLQIVRAAGIARQNLDLIYAIPGQSLDDWLMSLESAIALGTEHLSCYGLTYEPNTPIAVRRRLGHLVAAESELEVQMLRETRARLSALGLPPYEISNYSRPGAECLHNLNYWTGGDYLALGPSAASHIQGRRWRNRPHLGEWESTVAAGTLPAIEMETLSPHQRGGELSMLMLRLSTGIDYADFTARVGLDARTIFADVARRLARPGLLEVSEKAIRLSEAGIIVADSIAGEFLHAAAEPRQPSAAIA